MRFSKIISEKYNISVRAARSYIKDGKASIDGHIVKKDQDVSDGNVFLDIETSNSVFNPEDFIISRHENVIFFEKPLGMHSERHKPDDPLTMDDVVKACAPDFSLISRLDVTTDGVMAAVSKGTMITGVSKTYFAWIEGRFDGQIIIDNVINADKRIKVRVTEEHGGNRTVITAIKSGANLSLVSAKCAMATRHQIRAYLAYLGHPILGDTLYGGTANERIFLHCAETRVCDEIAISLSNQPFMNLFYN